MSLLIENSCIACDACVDECPNGAISPSDPVYVIAPERCTECVGHFIEPACVAVCPVDCIVPDPKHPESKEQLEQKHQKLQDS